MKRLLLLLGLAAIVAAEGEPCACPHALHRVCGSDGQTYSNPCTLNCAKHNGQPDLVKVHDGPCEPDEDEDVCVECDDADYEPVCGTDDKTYDNNCRLECASISSSPGVELKHEGECRTERKTHKRSDELMNRCACPKIYSPVCGTDGMTYPNFCVLECHMRVVPGLKLHYHGQCQHHHHHPPPHHHHHHPHHHNEKEVEPCMCPHALHRVCGSDGQTYSNPCTLNCAKRNGQLDLVKVHDGPCEPDEDEDVCVECDDVDYEPVCGTDDKTYDNNCRLECASISSSPGVELKHEGICRTGDKKIVKRSDELKNRCVCPYNYSPVCGTDGMTYPNFCVLQCHMRVVPGVELKHEGICRLGDKKVVKRSVESKNRCACTRIFSPVCGTDGRTYANLCILKCRMRVVPGLEMKHEGKCLHPLQVTKTLINAVEEYQMTPCNCPETENPVCGFKGAYVLTLPNECILNCKKATEGLRLLHKGKCTLAELFYGTL